MKNKIVYKLIICAVLILTFCSLFFFEKPVYNLLNKKTALTENAISNSDLQIHFIDCGQAESIAVKLPNNQIMLIDCGLEENSEKLANYLTKYVTKNGIIDYFIISHPHSDHMGGFETIFSKFDVKNFYISKIDTNDVNGDTEYLEQKYNDLINKANSECNQISFVDYKTESIVYEDFEIDFLSPFDKEYGINNYSCIMLLSYKNKTVLFTGDAEQDVEKKVLNYYQDEISNIDILKVGHHGSKTSSSSDFVTTVNPDYAIISCGRYNEYYHPHDEVIKRYQAINTQVYKTDTNGHIVCGIDKDGNIHFTYQFNNRTAVRVQVWQVVIICSSVSCVLVFVVKIDVIKRILKKIKK